MIPDTELYQKRKLIFLIVGGTYYNVCNSRDVYKDYLNLCGLRFPLLKGSSLLKEEQSYLRRNARMLGEHRDNIEKRISTEKRLVQEIESDLEKKRDLFFFLSEVCTKHARDTSIYKGVKHVSDQSTYKAINDAWLNPIYSSKEGMILPKIMPKDYAVVNERFYPMIISDEPVFVSLDGKSYTLAAGEMTAEEANSAFKSKLEEKLRLEALQRCTKVKEMEEERQDLTDSIEGYIKALDVQVYPHAVEWNDPAGTIGYDLTARLLYHIIEPHYNYTTGKTYSSGQCAATLPLIQGVVGNSGRFADRKDTSSQLTISSASHCLNDLALHGPTLTHKLKYLQEFAQEVLKNEAFYQISTSSDT